MASKNKNLAELLDANGDVLLTNLDNVSVTPTAVSDQPNTSTGGFSLPAGTTAQRSGSPDTGESRYNSDTGSLEFYDGTTWVATNLIPTVDSVSGTIYNGIASDLTLSLSNATEAVNVVFKEGATTIATVSDISVSSGSATVTVPSAVYGQTVGDTIAISVTNQDGTPSSNAQSKTVIALPSGGTITTSGDYRIHTFTSSGNFVVPSGFTEDISYVIVAGGGGAASRSAGGGGAGGVIENLTTGGTSISSGTYSLVVGGGGSGGSAGGNNSGNNGSNSTGFGQTATGGGASLARGQTANSGGSGGGCTGSTTGTGGAGTAGQGNDGGDVTGSWEPSGGGGGYSEAGQDSSDGTNAGDGGDGFNMTSYFGTGYGDSGWVAGGGGGGCSGSSVEVGGAESQGGGARGRNGSEGGEVAGIPGDTNTGGGGGGPVGAGSAAIHLGGGAGGSGVIFVAYQL